VDSSRYCSRLRRRRFAVALAAGNRTLVQDNAEGDLIKKSKGANAETWTYDYDDENYLVVAEQFATDGGTLLSHVNRRDDAFGNRINSQIDTNGDGIIDVARRYAHDAWNPAKAGATGLAKWDIWADVIASV
jgi:hypothetical protein